MRTLRGRRMKITYAARFSKRDLGLYSRNQWGEIVQRLLVIRPRRRFRSKEGAMDLTIPYTKAYLECGRENGGLPGSFARRRIALPCTTLMPGFRLHEEHHSAF